MYGNTRQSALSSCDGQTHLNWTRVLETVFFTLNEQTLHGVVNHSTSVVSETCRGLSLSAAVSTVLALLANQLLTSAGYFHRRDSSMGDWPQAEGALTLNDAVRQRMALLTGEGLLLRTLTAPTDSVTSCQLDSDNEHLITLLTALLMAMIFRAATSSPFSSRVCLWSFQELSVIRMISVLPTVFPSFHQLSLILLSTFETIFVFTVFFTLLLSKHLYYTKVRGLFSYFFLTILHCILKF